MRKHLGKIVLGLVIGCAFLWLWMGISVSAKEMLEREENNQCFLEQEKVLIREVRGYLATKGYYNSGVTVSRIVFGDGTREYKVVIHHDKINKLNEEAKIDLMEELKLFDFEDDAEFRYEFLK